MDKLFHKLSSLLGDYYFFFFRGFDIIIFYINMFIYMCVCVKRMCVSVSVSRCYVSKSERMSSAAEDEDE